MNEKPKILVVGSFVMDLVALAERAPDLGETVIGSCFKTAPGGKGANQAVQASRLGVAVDMAGCVGDDSFGKEMLSVVESSGIDTRHVKTSHDHPSGVGHIEVQAGASGVQNRIIVVPGANYDLLPTDLEWLEEGIGDYDLVMMQLELRMDTILYVARLSRDAGVPLMLNPAPAASLSDELLSCVTFLTPNETEAAFLSGIQTDAQGRLSGKSLEEAAAVLRGKGVDNVIITLGDRGAALCTADRIKLFPCVRMPDVKDPTAAGDSFVGTFSAGYVSGLSIDNAIGLAVHAAAITVCGYGAIPSLPTLDMVERLIEERGADKTIIAGMK